MCKNINREEDLKKLFNKSINDIVELHVGNDKDYFNALSAEQFVNLKKALSNINNIITLKTTLAFVDKLAASGLIEKDIVGQIKANINSQSANANGFDILWEDGDFPFVAEVKCNIPVETNKFGPAQLEGIYKDIINLMKGKAKAKVDVTGLYKFMVFLDCDKIEAAINNLKDNRPTKCIQNNVDDASLESIWHNLVVFDWNKIPVLKKEAVYICKISI